MVDQSATVVSVRPKIQRRALPEWVFAWLLILPALGFIGQPNMNLIPATVKAIAAGGLTVELSGGHVMTVPVETSGVRVDDRVEVGIRPENVDLGGDLQVAVRVLERLGGVSIVYGAIGDGVRFCASLAGDAPVSEGGTVGLKVAPSDCHIFDDTGKVLRRREAPALVA